MAKHLRSVSGQITKYDIPNVMDAIVIASCGTGASSGDANVLELQNRPTPKIGPEEVLIRVAASGVNRGDILQRKGFYPPPPGIVEDIPGLEVAGEVVACGARATRWRPGDLVMALVAGGGYARYCAVNESHCLPVPLSMDLTDAGGVMETYATVWSNLFDRGWVAEHDWALVHGGTSGIGAAAIGLCNAFGVNIMVTCASTAKCEAARSLGADFAVNYNQDDFVESAKIATKGRGVDAVLDMVGGDYIPRNLECLANGGRHVSIAVQRGVSVDVNFLAIMQRRLTLTGSTLRSRSDAFKTSLIMSMEREVWPLFLSGELKPVTSASFLARQAVQAHRMMEAGEHVGKIILTWDQES